MEDKFSLMEFKGMYTAFENERKKEYKKGERKVLNITQDLVAKQEKYIYSTKQAKSLAKAMKEQFQKEYKLKDIRSGVIKTKEFWSVVQEFKDSYQGTDNVNDIISQTFFGS